MLCRIPKSAISSAAGGTEQSWSLPEISELRYLEGDVDMNNKEIDVHYALQRV